MFLIVSERLNFSKLLVMSVIAKHGQCLIDLQSIDIHSPNPIVKPLNEEWQELKKKCFT